MLVQLNVVLHTQAQDVTPNAEDAEEDIWGAISLPGLMASSTFHDVIKTQAGKQKTLRKSMFEKDG